MYSVARVAYMLRFFGAYDVHILNGGMKKWIAEGRETFSGPVENPPSEQPDGNYNYKILDQTKVIKGGQNVNDVANKLVIRAFNFQIIDSSPEGDFAQKSAGLGKRAHKVPYTDLVNADGTLKSNEELLTYFAEKGIDVNADTIHSSGNGVSSCIVDLAMRVVGNEQKTRLFHGV